MEGNRVYLAACPDYGQAEAKLREAVAALGGMERFVRPGERILLKANLLRAAPPESAICTHPAVAAAAAKLVAEAGGTAVIDLLQRITQNVWGFDLNPLAVQTARVN